MEIRLKNAPPFTLGKCIDPDARSYEDPADFYELRIDHLSSPRSI